MMQPARDGGRDAGYDLQLGRLGRAAAENTATLLVEAVRRQGSAE
ncbi:MAG: hypothetical protein WKH64_17045 [Chloroflexia bacterium]